MLLEAVKTLMTMWRNPKEGQKMQQLYMKNVGLTEVFMEAVPTCLVMTILYVTTIGKFLKIINFMSFMH